MSERTVGLLGETPWPELARRLWEQELRPLREAVPAECRACPAYPRCLGGCRLSALAVGGRLDALDPLAVASQRVGLLR
jgi:radical SAM protein with 4Fe4S-binding SPASM domain